MPAVSSSLLLSITIVVMYEFVFEFMINLLLYIIYNNRSTNQTINFKNKLKLSIISLLSVKNCWGFYYVFKEAAWINLNSIHFFPS